MSKNPFVPGLPRVQAFQGGSPAAVEDQINTWVEETGNRLVGLTAGAGDLNPGYFAYALYVPAKEEADGRGAGEGIAATEAGEDVADVGGEAPRPGPPPGGSAAGRGGLRLPDLA